MNLLKRLYNTPVVKATLERMWRGGIAAVSAAVITGQIALSLDNADEVLAIFGSGALTTLLIALGISKVTKTGPALNKAEQIQKKG